MSTKTKWAHLPNAVHIDRVITSIKLYPDQWTDQWSEMKLAREAALTAARDAGRKDVWHEVQEVAWLAALDALLCLIAYDDCAYMLDSEVEELKILAALGDHKAILLLPACIAFNAIKKLQNVN